MIIRPIVGEFLVLIKLEVQQTLHWSRLQKWRPNPSLKPSEQVGKMTLFTVAHVHNRLHNELWRPELPPKPQTDVFWHQSAGTSRIRKKQHAGEKYDPSSRAQHLGVWKTHLGLWWLNIWLFAHQDKGRFSLYSANIMTTVHSVQKTIMSPCYQPPNTTIINILLIIKNKNNFMILRDHKTYSLLKDSCRVIILSALPEFVAK